MVSSAFTEKSSENVNIGAVVPNSFREPNVCLKRLFFGRGFELGIAPGEAREFGMPFAERDEGRTGHPLREHVLVLTAGQRSSSRRSGVAGV
jgi:hypothetical protein